MDKTTRDGEDGEKKEESKWKGEKGTKATSTCEILVLEAKSKTKSFITWCLHDYNFAITSPRAKKDVPFRNHPQSRMSSRHYPGTSLSCMFLSNH